MKLKLKEGCIVRKIGNDCVIIPQSGDNLNLMRMIKLNSSARFLLEQIQKEQSDRDDLVCLLMEKYEIERSRAEKDVDDFIEKLTSEKLLYS